MLLYGNVLKNYMLPDWSAKTSDQTSKEEEKKYVHSISRTTINNS